MLKLQSASLLYVQEEAVQVLLNLLHSPHHVMSCRLPVALCTPEARAARAARRHEEESVRILESHLDPEDAAIEPAV